MAGNSSLAASLDVAEEALEAGGGGYFARMSE